MNCYGKIPNIFGLFQFFNLYSSGEIISQLFFFEQIQRLLKKIREKIRGDKKFPLIPSNSARVAQVYAIFYLLRSTVCWVKIASERVEGEGRGGGVCAREPQWPSGPQFAHLALSNPSRIKNTSFPSKEKPGGHILHSIPFPPPGCLWHFSLRVILHTMYKHSS